MQITLAVNRLLSLLLVGVLVLGVTNVIAQQPYTKLKLEPLAANFTAPHLLVVPPGDDRRFVLDQVGQIWILQQDGQRRPEPFLDLSQRMVELNASYDERGLLGMAFHPQYQQNGRFFVYYSAPLREGGPEGWNHTSHLSEFQVSADPNRADAGSERVLLAIDQPQMNHNGGRICFGPDGYLYLGLGDGGSAGDLGEGHPPLGNGQDVTTLLGSVLRIDVSQQPYKIPADNPLVNVKLPEGVEFAGDSARGEIWVWGVRNPWGMSFDRATGDLYLADVGQYLWEEANRVRQAGNYGWRLKEGTHGFSTQDMYQVIEDGPQTGPLGTALVDPVIEHKNAGGHETGLGISMVGGRVYRGAAIPQLRGQYLFGNWTGDGGAAAGVVLVAQPTARQLAGNSPGSSASKNSASGSAERGQLWPLAVAIEHDQYILGFGEDAEGELYVLASDQRGPTGETGRVYKISER